MGMPIVAGLLALPVPGGGGAAEAATCPYNNYHYYSEGWSGTGNYGTGAEELTWTSWALDGHNDADAGFSDEAVWTIDNPDAVKGFYGDHVTVKATADADKKSVHIDSIAAAK